MNAQPYFKRGYTYRLEFENIAAGTPGALQEQTLQMENDSIFVLSRLLMRHNDSGDAGVIPASQTISNVPLFIGITDMQSGESLFLGNQVTALGQTPDMLPANALFGAAGYPIPTFLPHVFSTPLRFAPNSSLVVKVFAYSADAIPKTSFSFIGTKYYLR